MTVGNSGALAPASSAAAAAQPRAVAPTHASAATEAGADAQTGTAAATAQTGTAVQTGGAVPTRHYPFQPKEGDPNHRSEKGALADLDIFLARVRMAKAQLPAEACEDLVDFMRHTVEPIIWYTKKLREERRKWVGYLALTIGLLVGIPAGVAFLGMQNLGLNVTAQVTAVLAGVFATHRVISAWLDKRKVIAIWAEAQSALKTLLFELEDSWRDDRNGLTEEKLLRLKESLRKARAVLLAEQKEYYSASAVPTLDLGAVLTGASGVAQVMLRDFGGVGFKRAATREDFVLEAERKSAEAAKFETRLQGLRALIHRYEGFRVTGQGGDPSAVLEYLETLRKQERETELQLILARADADAVAARV